MFLDAIALESMNNSRESMFVDAVALENMNNFREFIFSSLFPSKIEPQSRSSGEAYAHRSSSVTFSCNSGEASLTGGRKRNVDRSTAKAPFTGAGAPAGLKTFAKTVTGQTEKTQKPRAASMRLPVVSFSIILLRPYPLCLFR